MSNRIKNCRLCQGSRFDSLVDLGEQYFTGIFPKKATDEVPKGNLELVKCQECNLVQLAHSFDLNKLYGQNYGYRSGLNQSMVRHLQGRVKKVTERVKLMPGDLVIDIGSNDSTLLRSYNRTDLSFVGIDPTGAKLRAYYPEHVQLIPDFFSSSLVKKAFPSRKAKVVTSIAMFYDLENPIQFAREVAEILDRDGVWVFEQSYLGAMLKTNSYDTICHEHLEYYGLSQIQWITERSGLKILDVEFNDVNGGSFCLTVARQDSPLPENKAVIASVLADEQKNGLGTLAPYQEFKKRIETERTKLLAFLKEARASGKKVYGYGASTKGNVLLQYCHLTEKDLGCIAEVNEDKFGAFTPGTRIPIVSERDARDTKPDYFLVLPWHFKKGILEREKDFLASGGHFVFPLPELEIV
ncbi:MAG: class I SAM-dependent methyltransferase [Bdellovibrionota bacterium]